jgi:hypothetical protein
LVVGPSEDKSLLFATTRESLYFAFENSQFEEVKGLLGRTTSVKQIVNEDNEYYAIQTDHNMIYRLNTDDILKKQRKQR